METCREEKVNVKDEAAPQKLRSHRLKTFLVSGSVVKLETCREEKVNVKDEAAGHRDCGSQLSENRCSIYITTRITVARFSLDGMEKLFFITNCNGR